MDNNNQTEIDTRNEFFSTDFRSNINNGNSKTLVFKTHNKSMIIFPPDDKLPENLSKYSLKPSTEFTGGFSLSDEQESIIAKSIQTDGSEISILNNCCEQEINFSLLTKNQKMAYTEVLWLETKHLLQKTSLSFLRFCAALAEASADLPHGLKIDWYKKMDFKERAAQKWIKVGRTFTSLEYAHVGAYTPSEIVRLAHLPPEIRNVMIENSIHLTIKKLEKLVSGHSTIIGSMDSGEILIRLNRYSKSEGDFAPDISEIHFIGEPKWKSLEKKESDNDENDDSDDDDLSSPDVVEKLKTAMTASQDVLSRLDRGEPLNREEDILSECTQLRDILEKIIAHFVSTTRVD